MLVVLLGIVGALIGGNEETASKSDEEKKEAEPQDKPGDKKGEGQKEQKEQKNQPVEEPDPINLSGVGQTATEPFELESGLAVFEMTHEGGQNFIVQILDENGQSGMDSLAANVIGPFRGSHAMQAQAGRHVLDVQADGPWTITVEQLRPSSAPQTTSFEGTGKTVTDPFELSSGLKRFELAHQGQGNFIVELLDENGARAGLESLLVNEIGSFEGSKAIRVPEDGIYLLRVEADGPWSSQVE